MKFYKISVILLFLLVFSIGFVCAEDVDNVTISTTDADVDNTDLTITDEDTVSSGEKTFNDLNNLINSSSSATIEIKDDYKYNNESGDLKKFLL